MKKNIGTLVVVLAYFLTLITQLPHVFDIYNSLEKTEHEIFGLSTAWGAAIAFEATVAIFTWRIIANNSEYRSRWTKPGIVGFLIMSAMTNFAYYFDIKELDETLMPGTLAVAIPLALWLYAEEFGSEAGHRAKVAREEREKALAREQRHQRKLERIKQQEEIEKIRPSVPGYITGNRCWCGEWEPRVEKHKTSRQASNALNAHKKFHKREVRDLEGTAGQIREWLTVRYRNSRNGGEGLPDLPTVTEIDSWVSGGEL
jgi:hypothetical protein